MKKTKCFREDNVKNRSLKAHKLIFGIKTFRGLLFLTAAKREKERKNLLYLLYNDATHQQIIQNGPIMVNLLTTIHNVDQKHFPASYEVQSDLFRDLD